MRKRIIKKPKFYLRVLSTKFQYFIIFATALFTFQEAFANGGFESIPELANSSESKILADKNPFLEGSLDCSDAIPIKLGQTYAGDNSKGKSNVSVYNGDAWWNCTGNEIVYSIEWPGGAMKIDLTDKTAANLALIVLKSCDPTHFYFGTGTEKINTSHIEHAVPKGSYTIVIDGRNNAEGTYNLTVNKLFEQGNEKFYLNGSTLYKVAEPAPIEIAQNVAYIKKAFGYIDPESNPLKGKEEEVIYIKKIGAEKPTFYYHGSFDSEYLKQNLICNAINLNLYGSDVFKEDTKILDGCDVLRCENGYTLAHQLDGTIKIYRPENSQSPWLNIKQIITVDGITYYIKADDLSIWRINGAISNTTKIGPNGHLLQDNDNQLINVSSDNKYTRWIGNSWISLEPIYITASPKITDEGFWFFMQAKSTLDMTQTDGDNLPPADYRKGLYFKDDGSLAVGIIPETGDCDRFLWRTKDLPNNKKMLINKKRGAYAPLRFNSEGNLSFEHNGGENNWSFSVADKEKYGTNGLKLLDTAGKALSFNGTTLSLNANQTDNTAHIWVLQLNQLVKDYFLPLPSDDNLDAHFLINETKNVYKITEDIIELTDTEKSELKTKLKADYPKIQSSYNKFLKGANGVSFFATNTTSDWALANYYFIIKNVMNAVKTPKPAYGEVSINDLSYMEGRNLIVVNKNDLNANIVKQYFSQEWDGAYLAITRGGAVYRAPFTGAIITSEELTCKTGIVNRPLDENTRRFDHGIHEFGHALVELGKWVNITNSVYNEDPYKTRRTNAEAAIVTAQAAVDDAQAAVNSAPESEKAKKELKAAKGALQLRNEALTGVIGDVCWDFKDTPDNVSPECMCAMIQSWFNNDDIKEYYPSRRAYNNLQKNIMKAIFNVSNTWMPPKAFRANGYLPSKSGVKDREGNHYKTALIGTQTWMAENLRTTKCFDENGLAQDLSQANTPETWKTLSLTNSTYNSIFFNQLGKEPAVGYFYNIKAISTPGCAVCPEGYRIPSQADFLTLYNKLGKSFKSQKQLILPSAWPSLANDVHNNSGFSAIPTGGIRGARYDGVHYDYYPTSTNSISGTPYSLFWSNTTQANNRQYLFVIHATDAGAYGIAEKDFGFSVRCIKAE